MIRRWISTLVLIIICFLLQTTVFDYIKLANVIPNLMVVLTVSNAYIGGQKDGMITGLLCGLLSDMMFGSVIGLRAFIYLLIGYLCGYSNMIYWKNNFSVPLILVGVSDCIYGVLFYVFEFLLRGRLDLLYYFRTIILPEAVYSMLVAIVLYKIVSLINKLITTPFHSEEEI